MKKRTEHRLTRFMSKILRHEAKTFGLEQDENSYVNLLQFIHVLRNDFQGVVSILDIVYLLSTSEKDGVKRFQVEGNKVRATYNHTWKKGKQLNDDFINDEL